MLPPPSPARADFTLMTECTPESSGCYSVYSVAYTMWMTKCGHTGFTQYLQYDQVMVYRTAIIKENMQ